MTTLTDRIAARKIAAGIVEAREHGHPDWSHVVAYGPCTKPSRVTESPFVRRAHAGTLTPSARTLATED